MRYIWIYLLSLPILAQWHEVRSPHFHVLTDAGAEVGREVAHNLEQIRAVFESRFPDINLAPNKDLVVFAISSPETYDALIASFSSLPKKNPGVFSHGWLRHHILLRTDNMQQAFPIVLHEFTHMIVNGNFPLPLWMNEGLADFFAEMKILPDQIEFGMGRGDGYLFRSRPLIPLEEFTLVDQTSPMYNESDKSSVFYAQAWLLTHYVLMSEEGRALNAFNKIFGQVVQGVPSAQALAEVFGDLRALETKLKAYGGKLNYPYFVQKTKLALSKESFAVAELSPAQLLSYQAVLATVNKPILTKEQIQALSLAWEEPGVLENLSIALFYQRDMTQAIKYLMKQPKADQSSWISQYILSHRPGLRSLAARGYLQAALDQNPRFAQASYELARLLKDRDTEQALNHIRKALLAEPGEMEFRLLFGQILQKLGRLEAPPEIAPNRTLFPDDSRLEYVVPEEESPLNIEVKDMSSKLSLPIAPGKVKLPDGDSFLRDKLYEQPLLKAVWTGDKEAIERELARPDALDQRSLFQETALHLAAQKGDLTLLQRLLEAGADKNALDSAQWTPLMVAVLAKQSASAKALINAGAALNPVNQQGQSALTWACFHGDLKLVKLMLSKRAERKVTDKEDHSLIDYTDSRKAKEVYRLLLDFKVAPGRGGALKPEERRKIIGTRDLALFQAVRKHLIEAE